MPEPIPQYVPLKKPVDPVARSLARPDAFAKPGTISSGKGPVRVRLTNEKVGRRRKKRDRRDVTFY